MNIVSLFRFGFGSGFLKMKNRVQIFRKFIDLDGSATLL